MFYFQSIKKNLKKIINIRFLTFFKTNILFFRSLVYINYLSIISQSHQY